MIEFPKTRRDFIKTTAAGAAGIILARPQMLLSQASGSLRIEEPFHGAVLNRRHGKQDLGGLKINVTGQASVDGVVIVNG